MDIIPSVGDDITYSFSFLSKWHKNVAGKGELSLHFLSIHTSLVS